MIQGKCRCSTRIGVGSEVGVTTADGDVVTAINTVGDGEGSAIATAGGDVLATVKGEALAVVGGAAACGSGSVSNT